MTAPLQKMDVSQSPVIATETVTVVSETCLSLAVKDPKHGKGFD